MWVIELLPVLVCGAPILGGLVVFVVRYMLSLGIQALETGGHPDRPYIAMRRFLALNVAVVPLPTPPDPARAICCAICQAPTALTADDCPSCGLVFLSRVPKALRARQDYTVLRPLGGGGMSRVYLARSRSSNQLCVFKTLASVDERNAPA